MKYVLLAMAVLFTAGLAFAADCCGCKCAKCQPGECQTCDLRVLSLGLAYWGVYPSGYTPLFLLGGSLVAAGGAFVSVGGTFLATPLQGNRG